MANYDRLLGLGIKISFPFSAVRAVRSHGASVSYSCLRLILANSGVLPLAAVKFVIGRAFVARADAEQRAEGVERVEPLVKAEGHNALLSVSDMRDSLTLSDRAIDTWVSPFAFWAITFSTCAAVNARGVLRLLLTISAVFSDLFPSNRWERLTQARMSQ